MNAMLASRRWTAETVYVDEDEEFDEAMLANAASSAIDVERVTSERLAELTKTQEHQGFAARMPAYPYGTLDDVLADRPTHLLILDRIQYPMNFGTILRSAEVFGVTHVVVPATGQSDVTASVARMSAGAVFHAHIAQVDDLADAVRIIRESGWTTIATTPEHGQPCDNVDLAEQVALVIGRESDGVSPEVLAECERRVMIPQLGQTQSLNAAASAAILLYEMSRQSRTVAQ